MKLSNQFSYSSITVFCYTLQTQLVKIAASLEDVNARLGKIENGMPGGGSDSWGARRKSSYRRSLRSNRLGSYGGPSLSPVPSEDVGGENNENMG